MLVDRVYKNLQSKTKNYVIFQSTQDASFEIRLEGIIKRVEKLKELAIFVIVDTNIQFAVFLSSETRKPTVEINFKDRQNGFFVFEISFEVYKQFFQTANVLK